MGNFISINPSNGQTLESYPCMQDSQLAECANAAFAAYGNWRHFPLAGRLKLLGNLATLLESQKDTFAELAVREMGKPVTQAIKEVEKCALACRYYAEHGGTMLADEFVPIDSRRSYIAFEPIGPVLCIMPWNFPYWQVIRFAAPALAAGNTVLLKHAENTTGVAWAIQRLFNQAGFPGGCLQTILASHPQIASLIANPIVRAVTLTGSERAGKAVAAAAGTYLKKSVLELGGSDAYIVLADADIEAAATICVNSRLINNGQSCVAAKRFIIENAVYDRFSEAFVAAASKKNVGDPMDTDTDIGPLAKTLIRDTVSTQAGQSIALGARQLFRSDAPGGSGFFHPIVVLGEVRPGMPCFDEEVFGPVAALIRADSAEQAIGLANRSRYGLGGAIFSRDIKRAEHLARYELEAGFVVVNGMVQSDPRLPFGGIKDSGYGRELGTFGLREFVNVKTVVV